MVKNLSHNDWALQQFDKYLKTSYRNVLIHASIIEGILRNESGQEKFYSANKFLFCNKQITISEFKVFDELRNIRNSLIHDSFKDKLEQNKIDELRDKLMKKIHESYRISNFLNKRLFEKYSIERSVFITFDPS